MYIIQACSHYKNVLEVFKANEIKELITSPNLSSCEFWRIANSVLNKDKPNIPSLFNYPEILSCASDKAKMFSKNFNLNHAHVFLLVFHSIYYKKLHDIPIATKLSEKVITNLDFSKASGPYCEPEL